MLKILYEDPHLIVAEKPSGVESQSSGGFQPDMVSMIQNHIAAQANQTSGKICTDLSTNWGKLSTKQVEKKGKTGAPYVGVIHRLDRPVSGVMVYAKTQKAAAFLSRQVQEGKMKKIYRAVVCGKPVDNSGTYVDFLLKDQKINCSRIVDKSTDGGKLARMNYHVVDSIEVKDEKAGEGLQVLTLVEIELLTGRHHQIRVQMAGHGTPLYGDRKYGKSPSAGPLALCAVRLKFVHPLTGKEMSFSMKEKGGAFELF